MALAGRAVSVDIKMFWPLETLCSVVADMLSVGLGLHVDVCRSLSMACQALTYQPSGGAQVESSGTEPVAVRGADSRGLTAAAPEIAAWHAARDESANKAASIDVSEGDSDEEAALAAVAAAAEAVAAVTGRAGALPTAAVGPAGAQARSQRGTPVPAPDAASLAGADAAHAAIGADSEAMAAATGCEGARPGGAAALAGTQASVQRGAPVPAPAAIADERGAEAPQARRAAAEPDQQRALSPPASGSGAGSAPAGAFFLSTKPAKGARTAGVSGACLGSGSGSGMEVTLSPTKTPGGPPQRPRRVPPGPPLPAKMFGRAPPAHSTEGLGMRAATTHGTGERAAKERPAALLLDGAAAAAQSQPGAGGDPGGREECGGASGLQRVAEPTGGVPPGGSAGAEVPLHKGASSVEALHAVSGKTPTGGPGGGAVKARGGRGGKQRGLSVADVLNPNNAAYDPGFAAEYAAEVSVPAALLSLFLFMFWKPH